MTAHQIPEITAETRERIGSRYARRLRQDGRIPAVIYGHGQEPLPVAVNRKLVTELLFANHHLFNLKIDGKTEHGLVKEVQWDHLGADIVHLDFTRVDMTEKVELEITLEVVGESPAAGESGVVLDHPHTSLPVACRADRIPETLQLDVSSVTLEKPLTLADLELPEGVECTLEPETVLASLNYVKEQPEESAEEQGEPEVVESAEKSGETDQAAEE
jgi:large subunit ribosomal protein L25